MAPVASLTHSMSNATRAEVREFLQGMNASYSRTAGRSVRFECGHPLTVKGQEEMPNAELMWTHNSEEMTMDPSRMFFYKDNVDITDLSPRDSGVYACALAWDMKGIKDSVTMGVFSLQVDTPSVTRYAIEDEPLSLPCHSDTLGALFPSATRRWTLNGTNMASPEPTHADNVRNDVIECMTSRKAGVWACHVEDEATGREWGTAWYRLGVEPAPSLVSRWYRSVVENPGTAAVVAGCVLAVAVAVFFLACLWTKRDEEENEKKFKDNRQGWEKRLTENKGKGGAVTVPDTPPSSSGAADEEDEETIERSSPGSEDRSGNAVTVDVVERSETPSTRSKISEWFTRNSNHSSSKYSRRKYFRKPGCRGHDDESDDQYRPLI